MWPSMYGTIYVCECRDVCGTMCVLTSIWCAHILNEHMLNIPVCICLHTHVVSKCVWTLLHMHGPVAPHREAVDLCLRRGLGAEPPSMTTPVPLAHRAE